jgi:hypothetical protein
MKVVGICHTVSASMPLQPRCRISSSVLARRVVRDDERPEGIDLQASEAIAGRLAEHGKLGVPRRRQPVGGVVVLVL